MNKKLYTIMLLSSAVFLSGCFQKTATITSEQSPTEALSEWQKISTAIEKGESVACEMTHTESNTTGQYYVQGKNMRFDSTSTQDASANGSFLSDGERAYSWNSTTKEGVTFSIDLDEVAANADVQETQVETPDFSSEEDWNSYQEQGYTFVCTVGPLPENILVPPTDVTFTDLTEVTQQMQVFMNASASGQAQPSQEDIEALMEKYSSMSQ